MYIYMCVCVTYRHPPASACGHEGDWGAMFFGGGARGATRTCHWSLSTSRCILCIIYRSLQIFIIFCMYEYVWVCICMSTWSLRSLWVLCIILLISILGKSCRVPNVTLVHWADPRFGQHPHGKMVPKNGWIQNGAAFLLLVHWYPRTLPSVTETHSFGHRPRSQEQIGRWQCAWLSFPLDAHRNWDLFNKHGYPPVN